jgi:cell division protein FtsL
MGGSIKTAMVFLWFTVTLVVAFGSSVLKNKVQGLERQLASINSNIQRDIDEIHVLKAEWSHFNTPERLRKLAQEQLSLENAKPEQIINYSALHFNYENDTDSNPVRTDKKSLTTLVKAEVKKN